jgi:hypothetical protein
MDQSKFPELFSPVLVPHSLTLFESGNVVVKGTQGSGKSMLLALLQTDIRLAFAASSTHSYPLEDPDQCKFIAAGINLATNQALRSVARWSQKKVSEDSTQIQNCFVDYVNTWILRDLIQSVKRLMIGNNDFWQKYGLGGTESSLKAGLQAMIKSPELTGLLKNDADVDTIISELTKRIDTYLGFFNGRPNVLPQEIVDSQTLSIGQPISTTVKILRSEGCLNHQTQVFITIDQFEQLLEVESNLPDKPYGLLRKSIDQAIHRREPTLNFRVGTRPYAWKTKASEGLRDFRPLDLDELLRRKEHSRKTLFPLFAKDVFIRRLHAFGYFEQTRSKDPLISVFGKSPSPTERVKLCGPQADWAKILPVPTKFPELLKTELRKLAAINPLSAKLGIAWFLQQANSSNQPKNSYIKGDSLIIAWETREKQWWKKERIGLATLQLAADNRQRVPRFGKADILSLSGANILVFASLCQHIWDCWVRDMIDKPMQGLGVLPIDWTLQDEGIRTASHTWHEKICEEPWVGDSLQQFIDEIGGWLRIQLKNDAAMSYPGGNGFSLSNRDVLSPEGVKMLSEGADRGFLLRRKHTSKTPSRGESTKWYLHPILSPYFEITVIHTKEPRYLNSTDVQEWLEKAGIVAKSSIKKKRLKGSHLQKNLPGFEEE